MNGLKQVEFISILNNFDEYWIILGGFSVLSKTTGSIYWDDIKIIDLGPEACPEEWVFDNHTFNNGAESYQASNKITIGEGSDESTPYHGPVIFKAGSSVKFKAGEVIELQQGIVIESGG